MNSRRSFLQSCLVFGSMIAGWLSFPKAAQALGGPMPSLRQPAPEFTLPTNLGDGQVSLSDYRGKWVVLYFYPKDFTAGCTIEARRFQHDLPKYQAQNAQIIGISADSVDSHTKFCDSEGLKFPLLSDRRGQVSKSYGSWLGVFSLRHTFIIDPQGVLQAIFTNVDPTTHSQDVLAKLEELQKAAA